MNFRVTLVLVLILVLLGGAVLYTQEDGTDTPALPTQVPVVDLSPEEITRVTVSAGGARTTIEQQDGQWRLVEPEPGEADATRAGGAVEQLATMAAMRHIETTEYEQYGLAEPTTIIGLGTSSGAQYDIQVGSRTPDNTAYYVKPADAPGVYVVPSFALSEVLRWPTEPPRPVPTPTPPPVGSPSPSPAG